jgi:small subunit ribosomal protein S14
MPPKAKIVKAKKKPKYSTRQVNRCLNIVKGKECGRARAFYREFSLCRIHLREQIYKGLIPGVKKAS